MGFVPSGTIGGPGEWLPSGNQHRVFLPTVVGVIHQQHKEATSHSVTIKEIKNDIFSSVNPDS